MKDAYKTPKRIICHIIAKKNHRKIAPPTADVLFLNNVEKNIEGNSR